MKKIAVITLNHGTNYGNKLQNYAVQTIYEKLGYEAETIRFYPEGMRVQSDIKRKIAALPKKIKRHYMACRFSKRNEKREEAFRIFNSEYLKMTKACYTPATYHSLDEQNYDFFSVGSDQVWNSYFFDFTSMYLLDFVKDDSKKIAYAASFGVEDIAVQYRQLFKETLSRFHAISVRENSGADIIWNLCKRPAAVVVDPTLMLDVDDWSLFIKDVSYKVPDRYILSYFLGEVSRRERQAIRTYAKEQRMEWIELNNLKKCYYAVGPKEFVYLFSKASMVFTDSFHACCFSLQFEKPFWVFARKTGGRNMESRVDTFLKTFHLEQRKYTEDICLDESINFSVSKAVLDGEKKRGLDFLKTALMRDNL